MTISARQTALAILTIAFATASNSASAEAPPEAPKSNWDWATGPSSRDAEGGRDWGVEIVPYLWIASLNGPM